jgi:hypothetical protein
MGADLIGASYIALPFPEGFSKDAAHHALQRAVFSLTEEQVDSILEGYGIDGVEEDESSDGQLLDYAKIGLDDYIFSRLSYHRYHTSIAISPDESYWLGWAGGTSYGDDPYDDWTSFCIFLAVVSVAGDPLVEATRIDTRLGRYLKPLSEVI